MQLRLSNTAWPAVGLAVAACLLGTQAPPLRAQSSSDLSQSSLEELTRVKIKVSSASRKDEDADETPAAVYVITREDIAHSAASSIPELLRAVPGLQVAQITASTWAVSARGFNSAFANKLLVLIDGRTVYSEIYAGAHWDEIDLPLQDIDRIEVIRGPGAAVWGANAANGVINILTLPARNVQGTHTAGSYSRVQRSALAEKGGMLGDRAQYRAYGALTDRRPLVNSDGSAAFDGEVVARAGGRIDWQRTAADHFIVSGEGYRTNFKQQVIPGLALPIASGGSERDNAYGGFVSANWRHDTGKGTSVLQSYAATGTRNEITFLARTRTFDADFVHHGQANSRVDLVWGSEARYTQDYINGPVAPTTVPTYNNYLVNGFLQADVALKPHKLIATFGSKAESSTLTGFQLQPSARLMWLASPKQSVWGAVSRAVVAPSIQDVALAVPVNLGSYNGLPVQATLSGNPNFKPEEIVSGELGYRWRPKRHLSADLALFRNANHRIQSFGVTMPTFQATPTPRLAADWWYGNGFSGTSQGAELSSTWRPTEALQISAAYTCIEGNSTQKEAGNLVLVDVFATPRNNVSGSFFWSFARGWQAGAFVQNVGRVGAAPTTAQLSVFDAGSTPADDSMQAYTRFDAHLKRTVGTRGLLEAGGTNLLQARHAEFASTSTFIVSHWTPRSLFVRGSWSF